MVFSCLLSGTMDCVKDVISFLYDLVPAPMGVFFL